MGGMVETASVAKVDVVAMEVVALKVGAKEAVAGRGFLEMEIMDKMAIKNDRGLKMKSKLILGILFGLMSTSFASVIVCDTKVPDQEVVKTSETGRAKDGEDGESGALSANGQNGQHGQKGKKDQNGGNGGKGGNSWFGRGGDGGNGADVD